MGEDPRAADERRRGVDGLRAGGRPEGRADGRSGEAGRDGGIEALILDESGLEAWGEEIGRSIRAPAVLALSGELGAGKSVLARAIARGAGVHGPMPSPTFNLVLRYPAANDTIVTHIDLFRLEDIEEVRELGWSELGAEGEIVLIEWPERAAPLLPPDRWEIRLDPHAEPGLRIVSARPVGNPPRWHW